eukprot:sb/3472764/
MQTGQFFVQNILPLYEFYWQFLLIMVVTFVTLAPRAGVGSRNLTRLWQLKFVMIGYQNIALGPLTVFSCPSSSYFLSCWDIITAWANKKGGSEILDFSGTLIPMVLKFWHDVLELMPNMCTKFQVQKCRNSLMNLNSSFFQLIEGFPMFQVFLDCKIAASP